MPGILSAAVTLTPSKGTFEFDPQVIGPRDITNIVEDLGYGCSLITQENRMAMFDQKAEIRKWRVTFFVSLVFGVLVMAVMVYFHWMRGTDHGMHQTRIIAGLSLDNLLLFALCTPVQVLFFIKKTFSLSYFFLVP